MTVPLPEDFKHAEKDALLQLKIGRSAHLYAIFASTALAVDGFLLLFFYPQLPAFGAGETGTVAIEHTFFLVLPLLGGLAVAGTGLASKWGEFQLWPWDSHFSVTVAAVAANVLVALVYALRIAGIGPFAHLSLFPWFYAAELAGISLALIGIALTWSGWSPRQWASAISAVLPVASALLVYFPPSTSTGASAALVLSLFISAIFYQTSGSFLHLISSGTRPHERELITSGQTRMFTLADDIRKREEAVAFREAAIVKRESDVENSVLSIKRQNDSLTEAREQLDGLEGDYRQRSDAVTLKEREWAGKVAEMDSQRRVVEDKTTALELREQEVSRLLPQISAREARLVEQEGEQTKRAVELNQREQVLAPRETAATETEARLEARRKELDQKTQEILRREGDLAAREAGPTAPVPGGGPVPPGSDLAARETKAKQMEAMLNEQNLLLGKKAREIVDRAKSVETALKESADKEAGLASREAALRQREATLADEEKAVTERRNQYESVAKDYASRLEEYGRQSATVAQKSADLDLRLKTVSEREAAVTAREARVKSSLSTVELRESRLTAREASVRATEAEMSLRNQAVARGEKPRLTGLSVGAAPAVIDAGPAPVEPPGGPGPNGTVRDLAGGPGDSPTAADTLATPTTRRFADRLPTGTPRLDDLLLGGIPPKGHVVLLGDPFVGKEVVLYGFVGEGLKRGEHAVLITASRSPTEVSESLGVVLPQFREYEQMGMVRWIDASGSGTPAEGDRVVLKSSDDRAGILSALVQMANTLDANRAASFRVAFLGLSAVLAGGDERASLSFLQNVVGILKPRNALAMYSLEAGALSEAQVETLLGRMDGAIVFRQDRDRLFLSVKGFGEVETREWIEARATQRQLIVGSFTLERIR